MEIDARIFVYNEKNNTITRVPYFLSVSTTSSLEGVGVAEIVFSNKQDRWYTTSGKERREKEHIKYVKEIANLDLVNYLQDEQQLLMSIIRSKLSINKEASEAIQKYYKLRDELELMNRVWIDFYRDGIWYSGFTGIISSLTTNVTAGNDCTISLHCKDLRRYWEITEILLQKGLAVPDIFESLQIAAQTKDPRFKLQTLDNIYQGKPPVQIVSEVLEWVNRFYMGRAESILWDLDFFELPFEVTGEKENQNVRLKIGDLKGKNAFFGFTHRLFDSTLIGSQQINSEVKKEDITAELIQSLSQKIGPSFDINSIPQSVLEKAADTALHQSKASSNRDKLYKLLNRACPKFAVDSMIGVNITILAKVFRTSFEFFQHKSTFANQILQQVCKIAILELYSDSSGNIILQQPKLNSIVPVENNEYEKDSGMIEKTGGVPNKLLAQYYHGMNYLIGSKDLLSFNLHSNEEKVYTKIRTTAGLDFLQSSDFAALKTALLEGASPTDRALENRFGVREATIGMPVANMALLCYPRDSVVRFIDTFADAVKTRYNADIDSATLTMLFRPDFQLGRNIYIIEKDMTVYIQKIKHSFVVGVKADTVLSCNYGHRPFQYLADPWTLASREQESNYEQLTEALEQVAFGVSFLDLTKQDSFQIETAKITDFKTKQDISSDQPTPVVVRPLQRKRKLKQLAKDDPINAAVIKWGNKYQIDPDLILAVIEQESAFRPKVIGLAGEKGLMQLMPLIVRNYKVADPFDIDQNIEAGTRLLRECFGFAKGRAVLNQFSELDLALAFYNGGYVLVKANGFWPPVATKKYISSVRLKYDNNRRR